MIYNNIFSKPMFPVSWSVYSTNGTFKEIQSFKELPEIVRTVPDKIPYTLDSVLLLSQNKMILMNSLQMKTAIIIGVLHMVFGILLNFT